MSSANTLTKLKKILFSRTTGPISNRLGTKHPWVKGSQVCSNEKTFNSDEDKNVFFSSLNQRYDKTICVYCFELFSQVSDVDHRPLVLVFIFNNMLLFYFKFLFYMLSL